MDELVRRQQWGTRNTCRSQNVPQPTVVTGRARSSGTSTAEPAQQSKELSPNTENMSEVGCKLALIFAHSGVALTLHVSFRRANYSHTNDTIHLLKTPDTNSTFGHTHLPSQVRMDRWTLHVLRRGLVRGCEVLGLKTVVAGLEYSMNPTYHNPLNTTCCLT